MHRIHHSIHEEERNSNYGSVFSIWDRLFRTNINKDFTAITFGVEEKINFDGLNINRNIAIRLWAQQNQ